MRNLTLSRLLSTLALSVVLGAAAGAAQAQDQIQIIEREQLPDIVIDPPEEGNPDALEGLGLEPEQQPAQQPAEQQAQEPEPQPAPEGGEQPAPKKADKTPSIEEIEPTPEKKEVRVSNAVAEFSGLDKITGRTINFDVYVNETVQFGALQVTPKVCYSRPDAEEPKTDTFVEVDEITLDRKIRRIFTGWMFAESPGISAVEHPVYDVWLKACKQKSDVPPPQAAKAN